MKPSLEKAAQLRDVAARHSYVFDNGLSNKDFFDLPKRMASEEFSLLVDRINVLDSVLEVGTFTGLNLLGLEEIGHKGLLAGVDFVEGAIDWLITQWNTKSRRCNLKPYKGYLSGAVPSESSYRQIICFDVLEHQLNVGTFLHNVNWHLNPNGQVLFLVPKGREYYDCGHVAFFPDIECLRNALDYVFEVEELFEVTSCNKLFAACKRRAT